MSRWFCRWLFDRERRRFKRRNVVLDTKALQRAAEEYSQCEQIERLAKEYPPMERKQGKE